MSERVPAKGNILGSKCFNLFIYRNVEKYLANIPFDLHQYVCPHTHKDTNTHAYHPPRKFIINTFHFLSITKFVVWSGLMITHKNWSLASFLNGTSIILFITKFSPVRVLVCLCMCVCLCVEFPFIVIRLKSKKDVEKHDNKWKIRSFVVDFASIRQAFKVV